MVHRDIKPENIMIRGDGFVKVLDFGIAKLSEKVEGGTGPDLDATTMVKTNPGLMVGTVSYMSPEQARGEHVEASTESLEVFKQLQDGRGVALSLRHMGDVAVHQLEYDSARDFYDQSLAILMEIGDKRGVASLLADMGDLACVRGDYSAARPFYEEGLVIFGELGDVRGIAHLLEASARMAVAQGRPERALRLAAAAATLREEFGAPLSPDDESKLKSSLDLIRQTLGQAASGVAWTEGRAMPTEKAIQYALASDTV